MDELPILIHVLQEFAATQHSDATVKSIFAEASAAAFRDPLSFNVINSSASSKFQCHEFFLKCPHPNLSDIFI